MNIASYAYALRFFVQAEDGIRDLVRSRGLGDVYKRQVQADLLLHVVDASHTGHDEQVDAVNAVLAEIGAEDIPQIVVWNKIDRIAGAVAEVVRDPCGKILNIKASAVTGAGIEAIRAALAEVVRETDPRALAPAA